MDRLLQQGLKLYEEVAAGRVRGSQQPESKLLNEHATFAQGAAGHVWEQQQPEALGGAVEGEPPHLLVPYPASLQWIDLTCHVRPMPTACKPACSA